MEVNFVSFDLAIDKSMWICRSGWYLWKFQYIYFFFILEILYHYNLLDVLLT